MPHKRTNIFQSDQHNARGIELADRGWLEEAMGEFQKAIELDPVSAHAHDNLGAIFAEKGQLLDALLEFVTALKAEGDNPMVHHYLASFLASYGLDLAISEYKKAIEQEFEFPDAHLNLAMALAEKGQRDEALKEIETAHSQAPDDEMIQHELACCLIDLERYPKAIEHLKTIIKNHPEHVEAYVDLGIAYTAQGFYAQAEGILVKAIELDPHDFEAHYHIAALYCSWDKSAEALRHLELAASVDRERIRLWVKDDRLFDALRNDEQFSQLLV